MTTHSTVSTFYYFEWIACAYCWLLTVALNFYLFLFWRQRKNAIFRKRYFGFVITMNVCAIVFVAYLAPAWILTYMTRSLQIEAVTYDDSATQPRSVYLFDYLLGLPHIVCQHLFTFVMLARFWLLHFEIKWAFNSRLLSILTPINADAKQSSWYVRHRSTWGSPRVFAPILFGICFVLVVCSCCVYWATFHDIRTRWIWYLCDTVLLACPVVCAFLIWQRTESFLDYFLIRKELTIVITCGATGLFGYGVTVALLAALTNATAHTIVLIVGVVFGATIYAVAALTSTFWLLQFPAPSKSRQQGGRPDFGVDVSVNSELHSEPSRNDDGGRSPRSSSPRSPRSPTRPSSGFIPQLLLRHMSSGRLQSNGLQRRETDVERASSANIRELTLYDCLENKYGFYAFLTHAFKEYSVENVLAVVEMHQYQEAFGGKLRDKRSLDYVPSAARADRNPKLDNKAAASSLPPSALPSPLTSGGVGGGSNKRSSKPVAISVDLPQQNSNEAEAMSPPAQWQWLGTSKQQSVPSESAHTRTTSTLAMHQNTVLPPTKSVTEEIDLTRKATPSASAVAGKHPPRVDNLSISAVSECGIVGDGDGDEQKSNSPMTPGGSRLMDTLKVSTASSCSAAAARRKRRNQKHRGQRSVMEDLQSVQVQNHWFELPEGLPPSTIVHDPDLSMREKISQLIDKYIERTSKYELNIGATHRSDLLRQKQRLQEVDDDDCAAIFNQTIYAVIALMHDSFIRFQKTHSYEQLRKMLAAEKDKEDVTKRRRSVAGLRPDTLL